MARTAYTYDSRFLLHDTGMDSIRMPSGQTLDPEPHPSSLRVTRRTAQLVANSGLLNELIQLPARPANRNQLTLVHTPEYVEEVHRITAAGGGVLARHTPVTRGSWDAAVMAAGTAIALADAVLDGIVNRAFGLLRPPGHHATASHGMGYCVFNNVAIAARHAQRERGVRRVAIIDWDVHHGNGTQQIFWDDADVLFVSLHQDNWYPAATGTPEEVGGPAATGATVNVALPPGTGNRGYEYAFDRLVAPVVRQFQPELLLVSAGQDASMVDPLGRMMVTSAGFRQMATQARQLAEECCDGRIVVLQEGGYSAGYVPFCTLAVLEGVVGTRTEVMDPLIAGTRFTERMGELRGEQEQAVERVREIHAAFWRLPRPDPAGPALEADAARPALEAEFPARPAPEAEFPAQPAP